MIDQRLSNKLFEKIKKLGKKIDWVSDRDLRTQLDFHLTEIHRLVTEHQEPAKPKKGD